MATKIKQGILTLHDIAHTPRGRTIQAVVDYQHTINDKIIRISDIAVRKRVREQTRGRYVSPQSRSQSPKNADMAFAQWEQDAAYLGPKVFADFMPNGAWEGRRCFIIGGGPSVKGMDLSLLDGELTIGINRAYELLYPTILFGVDGQLFGWAELGQLGEDSKKKFQEYAGFKVWMALHKLYPNDIYLVEPDTADGYRVGTTAKLAFKNNSGYGAINLAAALGANPIYLLGFDMHGDRHGKQKWWHDGYPVDYGEGVYKRYIKELTNFAPVLHERGFRVVNLNPKSALRCFEFGDYKRVMSNVVKRPKSKSWMVVSFYTKGTGYEDEVKKLEASLRKFNIPYHLFPCDPVGTWRGNLNHKSAIIRKAFDMFPNTDIVFIDSDGVVCKDPVEFTKLSRGHRYDVAAHFHQYSTSVKGGSLLSGTLWFANNQVSRTLVERWHSIGLENPTVRHQHCLNIAIHELGKEGVEVRVFKLPREYTQIFDYKGAKHGDAVIEHFQASRRLRKQVGQGGPLMDSNKIEV